MKQVKRSISGEFDAFADDLLAEREPRPLVIVGTAKVETLLLQVLGGHLLPKLSKGDDQDELLEGDRPLATLSARIKMCYRLGLIDHSLYADLDALRNVRNICAHSVAFKPHQSPARDHVQHLVRRIAVRRSYKLTQERFFGQESLTTAMELQCALLTLCVLLESIREKNVQTKGNKKALLIAQK